MNIQEQHIRNLVKKALNEMDDYFDSNEFQGDAKNQFLKDLEGDNGEFAELGTREDADKFINNLKRANLRLPSDEENLGDIQKDVDVSKRLGKDGLN